MTISIRSLKRCWSLPCFTAIMVMLSSGQAMAGQSVVEDALVMVAIIAVIVIILAFIFIPTIVAFRKQHPNRWLIFVINLAFGGTIVGWVAALVWALHYAHISEDGSNGGESGINLFVNDPKPIRIEPALNTDGTSPKAELAANSSVLSGTPHDDASAVETLRRLKTLFESGAISSDEYTALKSPILNRYIYIME